MKRLLLFLSLFAGILSTYAQDDSIKELYTYVKVEKSVTSERLDLSSVNIEVSGGDIIEPFAFDDASQSWKGKVRFYLSEGMYNVYPSDPELMNLICYRGVISVDDLMAADTELHLEADFSGWFFLDFRSFNEDLYQLSDVYIYKSDPSLGEDIGEWMGVGVAASFSRNKGFVKSQKLWYDVEFENLEIMPKTPWYSFDMPESDYTVEVPIDLTKWNKVDFSIFGMNNEVLSGAYINIIPGECELDVDAEGKATVYIEEPGDYYYYVSADDILGVAVEQAQKITVDKNMEVSYSFQGKGWQPLTVEVVGDGELSSLWISPVGTEYDEWEDTEVLTKYVQPGTYSYAISAIRNDGTMYPEKYGMVEVSNAPKTLRLSFNDSDYGSVSFEYAGGDSDMLSGSSVIYCDGQEIAHDYSSDKKTILLEPGNYTYVSRINGMIVQTGDFDVEVGKNRNISVDSSVLEDTHNVTLTIGNIPEIISQSTLGVNIYDEAGELFDSFTYERENPAHVISMVPGNYMIDFDSYGIEDIEIVGEFPMEIGKSTSSFDLDFSSWGVASVFVDNLQNVYSLDFEISESGKIISYFGNDKSYYEEGVHILLPSGDYEIKASAFVRSNNSEKIAISSPVAVSLNDGEFKDIHIDSLHETEGIFWEIDVVDKYWNRITNARVTVDGNVFENFGGEDESIVVYGITGSGDIDYKVEADGYVTYNGIFRNHEIYELIGGSYFTVMMYADDDPMSVKSVANDGLQVLNTMMESSLEIYNSQDLPCNISIYNMEGCQVMNGRVGNGYTSMPVGHLSRGMYLVVMKNKEQYKTVKVIKK